MTARTPASDNSVDALLAVVIQHRDQHCRQIDDEADVQARDIIKAAHREARKKVHEVIVDERRRGNNAINQQRAKIETAKRKSRQVLENNFLNIVLKLLETELDKRWDTPSARHDWVGATVERALNHLHPGPWSIEHPPGWSIRELDPFLEEIRTFSGAEPAFTASAELRAGLLIQANDAKVDASLAGLLVNRNEISAQLLAELFAENGS